MLSGNEGCDGGFVDKAYIYVQENGIQLDSDYPYVMHDNTEQDVRKLIYLFIYLFIYKKLVVTS